MKELVVKPALMFNLWTVPLKKAQRDRVDRTHRRHLRDLVGKYYKDPWCHAETCT